MYVSSKKSIPNGISAIQTRSRWKWEKRVRYVAGLGWIRMDNKQSNKEESVLF